MKISYIITTIRPFELCLKTIQSIKQLDDHDHEILISSPHDYKNHCATYDKVYYIRDTFQTGSVDILNLSSQLASGDWIAILTDDFHLINLDINEFKDFLQGDEMNKKTFKMFSFHPRSGHKIMGDEYKTPIPDPYQVMHMFILSRDTLNNQLDGVIFNHRFKHAYVDHWLGFYAAQHEQYKPYDYSLFSQNKPLISLNHDMSQPHNGSFDHFDYLILNDLYKLWMNDKNVRYNI